MQLKAFKPLIFLLVTSIDFHYSATINNCPLFPSTPLKISTLRKSKSSNTDPINLDVNTNPPKSKELLPWIPRVLIQPSPIQISLYLMPSQIPIFLSLDPLLNLIILVSNYFWMIYMETLWLTGLNGVIKHILPMTKSITPTESNFANKPTRNSNFAETPLFPLIKLYSSCSPASTDGTTSFPIRTSP